MSLSTDKLLKRIDKKDIPFIPNQLERVGSIFNIVQARYTLIGSTTGVGKTSFVDDVFILKPFDWLKKNKVPLKHLVVYFSMERRKEFKLAKFLSWKFYVEKGLRISADTILGNTRPLKDIKGIIINTDGYHRELTKSERKDIDSFVPWLEELETYVKIKDGAKTVSEILHEIEFWANLLGIVFKTDDNCLYKNNIKQNISFGKEFITDNGLKIPIIRFKFRGEEVVMVQNDKYYIPNDPNLLVSMVFDHIGKTKTDGYKSKKEAIDALDGHLSDARDVYLFNPIAISQFNRSLSDISRLKYSKGNLEPMYEDFKDTGNPVESADLVISLFDPYKYSSFDDKGEYKGYNIKHGTVTPPGSQRFRSLHIIKHSFGIADVTFGMRFTGESMHFKTLPRVDDINELAKIYEEIAKGN